MKLLCVSKMTIIYLRNLKRQLIRERGFKFMFVFHGKIVQFEKKLLS